MILSLRKEREGEEVIRLETISITAMREKGGLVNFAP